MNSFTKFFHEIMNPHCMHCEQEKRILLDMKREEIEQSNRCTSCETLQITNDVLVQENRKLVEALIDKTARIIEPVAPQQELKPIRTTSHIPWNVRRQMKEQESKAELRDLRTAAQSDKAMAGAYSASFDKDAELQAIEKELEDVSTTK